MLLLLFFGQFCRIEKEREFYTFWLKAYNCIVFTNFQQTKLYSFQNISIRFILRVFLKFRKLYPGYSYRIHSNNKIVYCSLCNVSRLFLFVCFEYKKTGLKFETILLSKDVSSARGIKPPPLFYLILSKPAYNSEIKRAL